MNEKRNLLVFFFVKISALFFCYLKCFLQLFLFINFLLWLPHFLLLVARPKEENEKVTMIDVLV